MPSIAHLFMGATIGMCLYYISDGKFTKTHVFILFLSNYIGPDVGWVLGIGRFTHSLLFWPMFALVLAYVYRYFTRFAIKIDGFKDIELIELDHYKLQYINTYFLVLAGGIMHLYLDGIMNKRGEFLIIPRLIFNSEEYNWKLEDFVNFGKVGFLQVNFLISIIIGITLIFGFIFIFIWFLKQNSKNIAIIAIIYIIVFLIFFYLAGSIVTIFHPDGGAILYVSVFWSVPIILCVLSTKDFESIKKVKGEKIQNNVRDLRNSKIKLSFIIMFLFLFGIISLFLSIYIIIFNNEILNYIFSNYREEISEYFSFSEVHSLIITLAIYLFIISLLNFLCGIGLLFKSKKIWKFTIYYHLIFSWTLIGLVIACMLSEKAVKEIIN